MGQLHKLTVLGDDLIERLVELTPYYSEKIELYKSKIDLDSSTGMHYGIVSQNKLGEFSEAILKQMRNNSQAGIDATLNKLIAGLATFDKAISKFSLFRIFESTKKKILRINTEYRSIESTVSKIELELEKQHHTLSVDLKLLEKLFEQNKISFEDLSLYIYAGETMVKHLRENVILDLRNQLLENDDSDTRFQIQKTEEQALRLERRIHNLKLSKVVSLQLAAQIRLIQSNNTSLLDKLTSCIVNTLPLWKNQMILSLNAANSQQALITQNTISKFINKVLRRNSRTLRRSSSQIARESERDIVNLGTLQRINADLMSTVYEVLNTQSEGRRLRSDAELRLINAEKELEQLATTISK